jgi:hypothetical protein
MASNKAPVRQAGANRTVKGGGMKDEEAAARAINAKPWEPPPGMVKRLCPECRYFFSAPAAEAKIFCPDCAAEDTRPSKPTCVNFN